MKFLSDIILSLVQLGEAELRNVKNSVFHLAASIGWLALGFALLLVGLLVLIWAGFVAMQGALGAPVAGVITGGGVVVLAVAFLGVATWRRK